MGDTLYTCRATIRNGRWQPIHIEEFRIWPAKMQMQWGPQGMDLTPGQKSEPSNAFNFWDDEDVRFLVRFKDISTGNRFWAEAAPEFGDGSNNSCIDVTVEEKLKVFHERDGHDQERADWVPL